MRGFNPFPVWTQVGIAARTVRLDSQSPGVIKSIQRGTIAITTGNTSNTATVSAVTTAKALVFHLGGEGDASATNHALVRLALTDATTITATRNGSSNGITVGYQLVEYY